MATIILDRHGDEKGRVSSFGLKIHHASGHKILKDFFNQRETEEISNEVMDYIFRSVATADTEEDFLSLPKKQRIERFLEKVNKNDGLDDAQIELAARIIGGLSLVLRQKYIFMLKPKLLN
jgi:hypothetical protein